MKKYLTSILAGIAIALGTVLWFLWLLAKHRRNLKDAEEFLLSPTSDAKNQVLEDLGVEGNTFKERTESLRKEVEAETKEEIIHAFKKAFGIVNDPDDGQFVGSAGPEGS